MQFEFQPSLESEARLLLLIARFSTGAKVLEGRTKLAKLDFLLRYPAYLHRALEIRRPGSANTIGNRQEDIENRMVRYRYGPWDPSYYAVLGRLIGKGLVTPTPFLRGIGYKATPSGQEAAQTLSTEPAWQETHEMIVLLHRHFNLTGSSLKEFIYDNFPEVVGATWGERL